MELVVEFIYFAANSTILVAQHLQLFTRAYLEYLRLNCNFLSQKEALITRRS